MPVRLVEGKDLSQQEREQQTIDAAAAADKAKEEAKGQGSVNEAEAAKAAEASTEKVKKEEETKVEFSDDSVLSYINEKRGTGFASMDEAFTTPKAKAVELPEDVEAFRKYKEETGRSLSDYYNANRDRTNDDGDIVLREHIAAQNPDFNADDITFSLNQRYGYDKEDASDDEIRMKQLEKKTDISKARGYFQQQKEQYKGILESSTPFVPKEEKEAYSAWKTQQEQSGVKQKVAEEQSVRFQNDTNSVFSNKFEGFNFKIGEDKVVTHKIEDTTKVRDRQLNTQNFINKHVDEKGALKDPKAYHKAMFAANDPDGLYKSAYETGYAAAIEKSVKDSKNINMTRNADASSSRPDGIKVTASNGYSGSTVKIKPPRNRT